jgi:hypothetical protein
LVKLISHGIPISLGIKEGQKPLQAIAGGKKEDHAHRKSEKTGEKEMPCGNATDPKEKEGEGGVYEGHPEIRLEKEDPGETGQYQEMREKPMPWVLKEMIPANDGAGKVQKEGELAEFRGLQIYRPEC